MSQLKQKVKKKIDPMLYAPHSPNNEVILLERTEVRVRLQMDDETNEHWVLVSVKSLVRPGLWGNLKVAADSTRLEYFVQKAAEALAVQQCELYQDKHNPPAVAAAALEGLRDLQEQARKARVSRGNG